MSDQLRVARRTVLQGALAGGALLTAAACSSGTPDTPTGEPTSPENPFGVTANAPLEVVPGLEYGGYGAEAYRKKYAQATVMANPTAQLRDVLQPRFAAGSPPDVVHDTGAKTLAVGRLVAEDQLTDLQMVLDAPAWDASGTKVQDTLIPGILDTGRYEGTLRDLNYIATVYGIWYSTQLFEKYNWEAPRTWPELLAVATEMKARGLGPFAYAGTHPYYVFEPILTLAAKTGGMDVVKRIDNLEDGAWKDESLTRALTAFGELFRRGLIAKGSAALDHTASQTRLMTSKVGLLPCGNWLENEMRAAIPKDFGLTVIGVPALDNSAALPRGLHVAPTAPFMVPAKAKNRPGGLEYLRAMLSREVAAKVSAETNQLTVVRGAADGLEISTALRSARDLLTAAGDQTITWYFADWYPELGKAAGDITGEFLAGAFRAEEWTNRMQRAADKVKQDKSVAKFHRD
jgi:N-acetylglucosamine transport system substrate-binding protein